MLEIYQDLRTAIVFRESLIDSIIDLTLNEIVHFETMILRVEYRLITFSSTWHFREDSDVQTICRAMLPIFITRIQYRFYSETAVTESLVVQLWEVLSRLDLDICWRLYQDLMIWAFLFGEYTSIRHPKNKWFVFQLANQFRGRVD